MCSVELSMKKGVITSRPGKCRRFCLFVLMLYMYIPVNNFSVMSGCFPHPSFWFEPVLAKQRIKCLAQPQSRTQHSTTAGESRTQDPSIPSLTLYH